MAAALLAEALAERPRSARAKELARRRQVAGRAARAAATVTAPSSAERALHTRRIIDLIDAIKPTAEPLATTEPREEALHALSEVGDRSVVPGLVARAVTGDVGAVDMLACLGDASAIAPLVSVLRREPQRYRVLEAAVARALASLGATSAAPVLRELLADNPMPSWREGIERGVLVKELVAALGALRDEQAGPLLLAVLEATSQEYRAILPARRVGAGAHSPRGRAEHARAAALLTEGGRNVRGDLGGRRDRRCPSERPRARGHAARSARR